MTKDKITKLYEQLKQEFKDADSMWDGTEHEWLKKASTSKKGNVGQRLCEDMVNLLPFCTANVIHGGIGDYDIQVSFDDSKMQLQYPKWKHVQKRKLLIEHKLATLDVNGSFQFNGISKSKEYDVVFALGVAPNKLFFSIQNKEWLVNNLTTNMTKDGGGYKWTVKQSRCILLTEKNFETEMTTVIENFIAMQCNPNGSASDDFSINTTTTLSLF